MDSFSEQIKKLIQQINKLSDLLDLQKKEIDRIKSSRDNFVSVDDLKGKEQEISDLKDKLQDLQTKKDNCSLQLNCKIEELNNSNLSVEDKSKKIVELVSGSKVELDKACHSLTNAWINYGKLQEQVNQVLEKRLSEHKWIVKQQEESKKRMTISIYSLLGVVILLSLSLSLSYVCLLQIKRKKKEN